MAEIKQIILTFDDELPSGYPGISKPAINLLVENLKQICSSYKNSSFISGVFPYKLKISKVKPIQQMCDNFEASNYRPISYSRFFPTFFERAMSFNLNSF